MPLAAGNLAQAELTGHVVPCSEAGQSLHRHDRPLCVGQRVHVPEVHSTEISQWHQQRKREITDLYNVPKEQAGEGSEWMQDVHLTLRQRLDAINRELAQLGQLAYWLQAAKPHGLHVEPPVHLDRLAANDAEAGEACPRCWQRALQGQQIRQSVVSLQVSPA